MPSISLFLPLDSRVTVSFECHSAICFFLLSLIITEIMCLGWECDKCQAKVSKGIDLEYEGGTKMKNFEEFSAAKFLDNLLTNGSCRACDETSSSFNNNELPTYYDEQMYKRGQAYFHKHIFGMFLGNLLGLLSVLAIKSSLAILILTKMSSTELTAYKRYVSTIFHMIIWYDSEFRPGSKLWESIKDVKCKHNSASKKAANVLHYRISQKDMALTQFGFMGLALARGPFLGIHDTSNEEDLKSFIHVWRVIGYVLGIDDEFNICRESVEETKAICNEIITRVMMPEVKLKDKEHRQMCGYLINGLWAINPFLNFNTFMFYFEAVLSNNLDSVSDENADYNQLNLNEKIRLRVIIFVVDLMRYRLVRVLLRYLQVHSLWMAKTSPYLAYYKFGVKDSYVNIMGKH